MSNDKQLNKKYEEYYRESDVGKLRVIEEIDDIHTTNDNFDYNFYPGKFYLLITVSQKLLAVRV